MKMKRKIKYKYSMHSNKISVIGDVISIDYPSNYSELLCKKKKKLMNSDTAIHH